MSPIKNKPKPDTDFSPIKKTTKKNSKKILDDSDDDEDGNVNGRKEKSDQESVNGASTKTASTETGSSENGDKLEKCDEVSKKDGQSPSHSPSIPKRKTGNALWAAITLFCLIPGNFTHIVV